MAALNFVVRNMGGDQLRPAHGPTQRTAKEHRCSVRYNDGPLLVISYLRSRLPGFRRRKPVSNMVLVKLQDGDVLTDDVVIFIV